MILHPVDENMDNELRIVLLFWGIKLAQWVAWGLCRGQRSSTVIWICSKPGAS